MRNLKRVLSLALSAIMLLGLMVMGAGAANANSFVDADEISHEEAATLLAGLEVFTGNELGEFDPEGRVTRAMMATIICKILHGADVNVKIYEGTGKFSDTVGNYAWAEGWVTMCSTLGIVNGYGDGRFGVDDTILTWQAAYMLERALGYWLPGDPSQGDQLSVMKTGSEIGLFGDLNLRANDQLTRDQVAEMTFNALFAQQVRWSDDRGNYVKANNSSVSVVAGTKDPSNTLARNVYQLYEAEGIVVANGMTDSKLYSDDDTTPGETKVVFDSALDILDTGRNNYSEYTFTYDTGLNMIGHNAGVYYQLVRGVPVVKAIVDRAILVEEIPYDANTTRLAKAANDLGFKRNTILNFKEDDYLVNYDMETKAGDVNAVTGGKLSSNLYRETSPNRVGKTLIVISNSVDYSVNYVFVLDQKIDQVKTINRQGVIALKDDGGNATSKVVAPVAGYIPAENDYVISTNIGNQNDRLVIEKPETVSAYVTQYEGRVGSLTGIMAGGVNYLQSPVFANKAAMDDLVIPYQQFDVFATLSLLLDKNGQLIGYVADAPADPQYCYVAWYGKVHINPMTSSEASGFTTEGLAAYVYCADGTKGVFQVGTGSNGVLDAIDNADKHPGDAGYNSSNVVAGVKYWNETPNELDKAIKILNEGFYHDNDYAVDAQHDPADPTKHGDCTGGLGIWEYSINKGVITLKSMINPSVKSVDETNDTKFLKVEWSNAAADGVGIRFVKGHSGVLEYTTDQNDQTDVTVDNVKGTVTGFDAAKDEYLWQTKDTVYFYVDGAVTSSTSAKVSAKTGVTNLDTFDVTAVEADVDTKAETLSEKNKTWVEQVFVTEPQVDAKTNTVRAVLVRNVPVDETGPIYYYTKGTDTLPSFRIREIEKDKQYDISYRMFDLDGTEEWKTFTFNGSKNAATSTAKAKVTGYYEVLSKDIQLYVGLKSGSDWTYTGATPNDYAVRNNVKLDRQYVVNATLEYDERTLNLIDNVNGVGVIFNLDRDTTVVDTCGSGLESLDDIINAFDDADTKDCLITISYLYDTDKWTVGTVFITEYAPTKTDAPGNKPAQGEDLIVEEIDRSSISVTSTQAMSAYEILSAVRDYMNDKYNNVQSVEWEGNSDIIVINFSNSNKMRMKVCFAQVADTDEVAGAKAAASAQSRVPTPIGNVTINGNKVTASAPAATTDYVDNTKPAPGTHVSAASRDLANFLAALHANGAQEIKFTVTGSAEKTYQWVDAVNSSTASKWAESTWTVANEQTLLKAIETDVKANGGLTTAGKSYTFTITVDGKPIDFTIAIPAT